MRRELLRERDLRSTQVSPSVVLSLLNKVTTRLFLPGSSARVKAFASLACRKGDGRFRSEADFSAFLPYVRLGSNSEVGGSMVDGLLCHCKRTSPDPRFRSAKGQKATFGLN